MSGRGALSARRTISYVSPSWHLGAPALQVGPKVPWRPIGHFETHTHSVTFVTPTSYCETMASEMQKGTFAVKVGLAQVRGPSRPRDRRQNTALSKPSGFFSLLFFPFARKVGVFSDAAATRQPSKGTASGRTTRDAGVSSGIAFCQRNTFTIERVGDGGSTRLDGMAADAIPVAPAFGDVTEM